MLENIKEKNYQLHEICLISVFLLGNLLITLPVNKGVEQSIFGLIFCIIISVVSVFGYSVIQSKYNGNQLSKNKAVNYIFTALLLVFILICYAGSATDFIELVGEMWLRDTAKPLIAAAFLFVSLWLALSKDKCIYLFALFSVIFIVIAVIVIFLLSLSKINIKFLTDALKFDVKLTVRQTFAFYIRSFGQIIICIIFIGKSDRKSAFTKQISAVFCAGILIMLILINTIGLLGTSLIKETAFPYATATSIISAAGDYTRLDAVTYYIYFITSVIKCAVIYKAALKIAKNIGKNFSLFVAVTLPAFAFISPLSANLSAFLGGNIIGLILLCFEIIIPVFLIINHKSKRAY